MGRPGKIPGFERLYDVSPARGPSRNVVAKKAGVSNLDDGTRIQDLPSGV